MAIPTTEDRVPNLQLQNEKVYLKGSLIVSAGCRAFFGRKFIVTWLGLQAQIKPLRKEFEEVLVPSNESKKLGYSVSSDLIAVIGHNVVEIWKVDVKELKASANLVQK